MNYESSGRDILSLGLRLVDIGATPKFQSKPRRHTIPTLTKTRAAGGGFWLTKLERRLLPKDSWLALFLGASTFKPLQINVGITMINHHLGLVYTNYPW